MKNNKTKLGGYMQITFTGETPAELFTSIANFLSYLPQNESPEPTIAVAHTVIEDQLPKASIIVEPPPSLKKSAREKALEDMAKVQTAPTPSTANKETITAALKQLAKKKDGVSKALAILEKFGVKSLAEVASLETAKLSDMMQTVQDQLK
jgi:hypothetical protein